MKRRHILIGGAAALLLPAALGPAWRARPARAQEIEVRDDDRVLGPADAPITIVEYSSLTCPHCARLHETALQQIKSDWVEPGKARLVYRHFPLDGLALRAAALANCVEGERFFAFLDLLFKSQERWAKSSDPLRQLGQLGRLAGLGQERIDACLQDQAEMEAILRQRQAGEQSYDINSTPTLVINGEVHPGALDYAAYQEIFERVAPGT